jgi:hypothetical protein
MEWILYYSLSPSFFWQFQVFLSPCSLLLETEMEFVNAHVSFALAEP